VAGAALTEAGVSEDALGAKLAVRIRAAGPLSLAEYMQAALWDPAQGYYATRDPLGARGDFITAPEISQIFGELIGLWFADCWRQIGAPDPVILCELGPGRGTLMADFLRAAAIVPEFRRALRLHLIEASPGLRAQQEKTLASASPAWHRDIDELPAGPLLLVANEFLDALPIHQYQRGADSWHERRIGLDARGGLAFVLDPQAAGEHGAWPVGSIVEARPAAQDLAARLGRRLAASHGVALFIDYGYYPSAPGDSFQALSRHRFADPLNAPGSADLTAHVDFMRFGAGAESAGAQRHGPVDQGAFLKALGAQARASKLAAGKSPAGRETIGSGLHRLVDPTQMGSLFKVLALSHHASALRLAGFLN
jgi:NADH dehydrogenase [ubiquinone] 1 alpha subcomplex assembly factor 7